MITVVGWPRSGTHWLKALLEHALGEEVAQSHACPEGDGQYVMVVRNPLDAFASHWRLYQHDHPDTARTELEHLCCFMEGHATTPHLCGGWVPHTKKLLELSRSYPLVYYEQLHAHTVVWLSQILFVLDVGRPLAHLVAAIQSTQRQRCDPSPLPVDDEMGKPGKGQTQLQPETVQALLEYCGETMTELGYRKAEYA